MLVRLKPSKNVVPSITATIAIVPGVASLTESPENGVRTTSCPSSRRANGAIRERRAKSTEKPSPYRNQSSAPKATAPAQVSTL